MTGPDTSLPRFPQKKEFFESNKYLELVPLTPISLDKYP